MLNIPDFGTSDALFCRYYFDSGNVNDKLFFISLSTLIVSNNSGILSSKINLFLLIISGICNISCVVGLFAGATCISFLITLFKSKLYFVDIFSYLPKRTFLYKLSILCPKKGGLSIVISYKIHPNDHISDLSSYGKSRQTSGEAYYGVPVCVYNNEFYAILDTFISPNLIVLFLCINIFADFMSL